jgi:hypothetical protein
VLSIVCKEGSETVWGAVSLHAERTPLEFDLTRWVPESGRSPFRLFDLLTHSHWVEGGQSAWPIAAAHALRVSPVPFEPYFWRIDSDLVDKELESKQ